MSDGIPRRPLDDGEVGVALILAYPTAEGGLTQRTWWLSGGAAWFLEMQLGTADSEVLIPPEAYDSFLVTGAEKGVVVIERGEDS